MSEEIDWDDIKWGSFTAQFKRYNSTHKKKLKDLKEFADMILRNPNRFRARTRKRANFYVNVIYKKKGKARRAISKAKREGKPLKLQKSNREMARELLEKRYKKSKM